MTGRLLFMNNSIAVILKC